jgi:hypothetical protein
MNKVVGLAIAGTIVYGIVKLLKVQNVSELATLSLLNPRVHQINLGGFSALQRVLSIEKSISSTLFYFYLVHNGRKKILKTIYAIHLIFI